MTFYRSDNDTLDTRHVADLCWFSKSDAKVFYVNYTCGLTLCKGRLKDVPGSPHYQMTCKKCGSKLYYHDTQEFNANNLKWQRQVDQFCALSKEIQNLNDKFDKVCKNIIDLKDFIDALTEERREKLLNE